MKMMKYPVHISKRVAVVSVTAAAIIVATGLLEFGRSRGQAADANAPQESGAKSKISPVRSGLGPVAQPTEFDQDRAGGKLPVSR